MDIESSRRLPANGADGANGVYLREPEGRCSFLSAVRAQSRTIAGPAMSPTQREALVETRAEGESRRYQPRQTSPLCFYTANSC